MEASCRKGKQFNNTGTKQQISSLEDTINKLINYGHNYNDIINTYSFERTMLFYYSIYKDELNKELKNLNLNAISYATTMSEEGGKNFKNYVGEINKSISKLDKEISRIINQNIEDSIDKNDLNNLKDFFNKPKKNKPNRIK